MSAAKTRKTESKGSKAMKPVENAFLEAADVLTGIDALFAESDDPEFMADLDDVEIVEQIREQLEDDEQDLASLGESLAKYQIQAILLRIMPAGHPKPYRLVAGERRYRAARLAGLTRLRAKAREMTDDEAEDFQWAENIHRKNLTQIEEAKKIQRDLDRLGSVEAVLEKYRKSRAWLSKTLSLLTLPEQARRLVAENVSADVEVINTVKIIEKADPEAAKALVENLKAARGKNNAREMTNAVKEKVKPGKKTRERVKAKPNGHDQEEPGTAPDHADEKANGRAPSDLLNEAYFDILERASSPETVIARMNARDKTAVDSWLRAFHDAGVQAKDVGRAVIQGFRSGRFASDGKGAFALVAFLHGAYDEAKYSLSNIFGSIRE
jgi:ParB family chromosome partitioning protein